jgi:hypothetical protein
MAKTGKIDIRCGVFDYEIVGPTVPLALSERHCFGSDEFGSHGDIQESWQSQYTMDACVGTGIETIRRNDPSTNIHWETRSNDVPYQYNIYWKEGCLLDYPGSDEAYPSNPLGVGDVSPTICQDLLVDNYRACNNGGVGGSIQAGCLVYEFKAQKTCQDIGDFDAIFGCL